MCRLFSELTCYYLFLERICTYRKGKQNNRRIRT
nr:MAG TPA: hypothetical protein [Caudoviricetes sp.]